MVDRTPRFLVSTILDYKGSCTLVGSAGEHQPVAIGNPLLKLLPSKDCRKHPQPLHDDGVKTEATAAETKSEQKLREVE
jgi:hypothetical protein